MRAVHGMTPGAPARGGVCPVTVQRCLAGCAVRLAPCFRTRCPLSPVSRHGLTAVAGAGRRGGVPKQSP
jgi:hypothetical protein